MKEPDYVMMLMTTYGTTTRFGLEKPCRLDDGTEVKFQYPKIIYNHFKYWHAVDDHNNRWQSPISIEKTWKTKWWPNRVFAFLLALTEINCLLVWVNILKHDPIETLEFWKMLAKELINNPYRKEEVQKKQTSAQLAGMLQHGLVHIPRRKNSKGQNLSLLPWNTLNKTV